MTILLANLRWTGRAVGIDVSRGAISIAQKARFPRECEVSFECVDEDGLWPGEFDTVVCIDVLHHIPRSYQRGFISKLTKVTPGRRIIFKDVSRKPYWKAFASEVHDLLVSRQLIHIPDEDEVKAWFQDEGMSVVESRRLDRLWYSHYLLVLEKGCRTEGKQ